MSTRTFEIVSTTDYLTPEKAEEICKQHVDIFDKYAIILHDRDVYTAEDEQKNPEHKAGQLKPAHVHVIVRCKVGKEQRFESLGKLFGVNQNFVYKPTSKAKSSQKKFESMLLYLTHYNAKEKFQYDSSLVICNFEYDDVILKAKKEEEYADITTRIEKGEINRRNLTDFIDIFTYTKNKREIDNALDYYDKATKSNSRNMNVVYLMGAPGTGKTNIAKYIAEAKGYPECDIFVTNSERDPFGSYRGEPVIIHDDFRDYFMTFAECLKMLDNHTNSRIGSRYCDKDIGKCEWMFITSSISLFDQYKSVSATESLIQLYRRIKTLEIVEGDTISVYRFNAKTGHYDFKKKYDNPIAPLIKATEAEADISEEDLDDLVGLPPKK